MSLCSTQRMPGLTGLETAEAMLAEEPDLPVVLYSAFADETRLGPGGLVPPPGAPRRCCDGGFCDRRRRHHPGPGLSAVDRAATYEW